MLLILISLRNLNAFSQAAPIGISRAYWNKLIGNGALAV
jgi:hypothetical protein